MWVFHDIDTGELLRYVSTINWWWVALAVCFDILSYICQGARWQLLLQPIGDLSLWRATQAIYAGLFVNEVLPMRPGEVVRAYLVSRWLSARITSVIPSMIVERLLDSVWLAVGVGLTLFGIEKTPATGFSVVVFALLTIPLWLIGFSLSATTGSRLAESSASSLERRPVKTSN